ncbi:hypothetical protein ONZ45_g10772 [Pleurotus djamor]|nr:hypothetical protein ONZ45_g10772 [Pleurotus djamor]
MAPSIAPDASSLEEIAQTRLSLLTASILDGPADRELDVSLATPGLANMIVDKLMFPECDKFGSQRVNVCRLETPKPGQPATRGREELVVKVTGMMLKHELPPQRSPVRLDNRFYHRRYVSLVGLGSPSFEQALQELQTDYGHAIATTSRFFGKRQDQFADKTDIAFDLTEDPQGWLSKAKNADNVFVHTEDNVVHYYDFNPETKQYSILPPRHFHDGDIVEANISFLIARLSPPSRLRGSQSEDRSYDSPKLQLILQLRALTRLRSGVLPNANTTALDPSSEVIVDVRPVAKRTFHTVFPNRLPGALDNSQVPGFGQIPPVESVAETKQRFPNTASEDQEAEAPANSSLGDDDDNHSMVIEAAEETRIIPSLKRLRISNKTNVPN